VRYVPEGVMRALHRKILAAADNHRATCPYRICERADAVALVPGPGGKHCCRVAAHSMALPRAAGSGLAAADLSSALSRLRVKARADAASGRGS
jgi:hypothetical protein